MNLIKANQWYRTRGGEIVFVIGVNPYATGNGVETVAAVTKDGDIYTYFSNGLCFKDSHSSSDLIEHLPDCDSFNWVSILLEAGKKYIQVNGAIVGPMDRNDRMDSEFPFVYDLKCWSPKGVRWSKEDRATENIVGEFIESKPQYEMWDFYSMPIGVKVQNKTTGEVYMAFPTQNNVCIINGGSFTYKYLFEQYTQLDGTPCGRKVS